MLPRAHRLRRPADFRAALHGVRAHRPTLVVHVTVPGTIPGVATSGRADVLRRGSNPAADSAARIGFAVSRAVGSSVVRHQVTRRLRHLAAERVDTLPPGTLVVVRALPAAAGATFLELRGDLTAALDTAVARARR